MLLTRTFVMLPEFDKQWANLGLMLMYGKEASNRKQ